MPNLTQTRAAGARDEMQPEIKPKPPTAATRCRLRDRVCKETKEKKIGLTPHYEQFRGLLAQQRAFDWQANSSYAFLPEVDALLSAPHAEQPALPLSAPTPANLHFDSRPASNPASRAFASAAAPAALQTIGNWETARADEINRTGTGGEDLFSGNYHWSLPLLNLPGRAGHDLNLTLSYNSLI